jgi:3-oxoacyl-[acyl-carrier-protein] synthase III
VFATAPTPLPLDLCSIGLSIPEERLPTSVLLEQERATYETQLAALSPSLRQRLEGQLGIDSVAIMSRESSPWHAEIAARTALERAGISPRALGLIVDYSTLATDTPEVWALSHYLQGALNAPAALALGTRGSGCAGLHLALLVTEALMQSRPEVDYALLVAADRAPDQGRCCLPISLMADAASALVVARTERHKERLGCIRGVMVEQCGKLANVLRAERTPLRMAIDGGAFERQVLPVHFVMLHRLLTRLSRRLDLSAKDITAYVYPNTTALDRTSIARGFDIPESALVGPGPRQLGHAFASDLLINAERLLLDNSEPGRKTSAWLAAGSGFTWGAAIIEIGA